MKLSKTLQLCLTATLLLAASIPAVCSAAPESRGAQPLKIGLVNFKECIEHSELGKKEQAHFDSIKNQMEKVLAEKEKALSELASKLQDEDYLDSLKPEAEAELRHQLRSQGQEFSQAQSQYYQTLQQSNFKILQNIAEEVTKAAKKVAERNRIDLILNDDNAFFKADHLDMTKEVVAEMNRTDDNHE